MHVKGIDRFRGCMHGNLLRRPHFRLLLRRLRQLHSLIDSQAKHRASEAMQGS
jgi:hypothetical protein